MTDYETPYWSLRVYLVSEFHFRRAWSFFTTDPRRSVWSPGRVKKEVAAEKAEKVEEEPSESQDYIPLIGGPLDGDYRKDFNGRRVKHTISTAYGVYQDTFYYPEWIVVGENEFLCLLRHESFTLGEAIDRLFRGYYYRSPTLPIIKLPPRLQPMSVDELFEELEEGVPISEFAENLLKVATAEVPAEKKKEFEIIGFDELVDGVNLEYLFDVAKELPESVAMKASGVIPGYENLWISPTEILDLVDDYELYEQLFSTYLKSRGR